MRFISPLRSASAATFVERVIQGERVANAGRHCATR